MRTLLALAALLVALAGSRTGDAVAAPVPKDSPPPSIDGKYTLLATSSGSALVGAKGGRAAAEPADFGGPAGGGFSRSTAARADTVITKSEITIESRTFSGAAVTMEYTLDPTKSPIAIDVETVSVRGKKTKSLGVVEVTGNRVTIALAREGAERPKTADEADGVTVYYFQKAPPPPRVEYRIVALTVGKEEEAEKELNKLAAAGYELVTTTSPTAVSEKASVTTVHFVLRRAVKQP